MLRHIASAVRADTVPTRSAFNQHETDSAACTRGFASHDVSSEPPVLKRVLRELYKRVHPDLFHDVPHAREANEHSFKLLQVRCLVPACRLIDCKSTDVIYQAPIAAATARYCIKPLHVAMTGRQVVLHRCSFRHMFMQEYLEFAKKGGELGRTAGVPYTFRFFLYKQDGFDPEPAEQDGVLSPSLVIASFDSFPNGLSLLIGNLWTMPKHPTPLYEALCETS